MVNLFLIQIKMKLKIHHLELVVAGTKDAVLMVESEASSLSEKQMLNAVKYGHDSFKDVIKMITDLQTEVKKEKIEIEYKNLNELKKEISNLVDKKLKIAFSEKRKKKRSLLINECKELLEKEYENNDNYTTVE